MDATAVRKMRAPARTRARSFFRSVQGTGTPLRGRIESGRLIAIAQEGVGYRLYLRLLGGRVD